jgi:hypothetical protein
VPHGVGIEVEDELALAATTFEMCYAEGVVRPFTAQDEAAPAETALLSDGGVDLSVVSDWDRRSLRVPGTSHLRPAQAEVAPADHDCRHESG